MRYCDLSRDISLIILVERPGKGYDNVLFVGLRDLTEVIPSFQ